MTDFSLIDAHHHIWAPQTDPMQLGYVWLRDIGAMKPFGDPTPIQRDYLLPEFLGETAARRPQGSVHVQTDPKLPDPVRETAFVQDISDRSGHPIMIVGYVDLSAPAFEDQLRGHLAYANLRGVRQIISYLPNRPEISFAPTAFLNDARWRRHYAQLAEHGLSFDLQLYPEQMEEAADFVAKHPDIPVIIDHLGSPYDSSAAGRATWQKGMEALASVPHVSVKLSGYAMFFGADLNGAATEFTQLAIDLFGTDRVMFGSNFPVDKLHLRYEALLGFLDVLLQDDAQAKADVLWRTAHRVYRFGA